MKIFAINPGAASTKIALYDDCTELWSESILYSKNYLLKYEGPLDEEEFRYRDILNALKSHNTLLSEIDAFAGRGGLLHPLTGGAWVINEAMISDLRSGKYGVHSSNLGAILAMRLQLEAGGRPSYIVDPVCVDEMLPIARVSGIPDMPRKSIFHALNQKAVAYRVAADMGRTVEECRFIVVHMGSGITVGAHCWGRVIDVNDALGGYGPMSPERAGTVHAMDIIRRCFSGIYTETEMAKMIIGNAGLTAHLGTNNLKEITERINSGDYKAKMIVDALAYQVACEIGHRSVALLGNVDAIILTGGLAYSSYLCRLIEDRVSWIADVVCIPGEEELRALSEGVWRVLSGKEKASVYESQ